MESTTTLNFTETKNGHATGKTSTNTAGVYINAVRNSGAGETQFGNLMKPTAHDEDGEVTAWHDAFHDLSVQEQLDLCIEVNSESYASHTTYEVA